MILDNPEQDDWFVPHKFYMLTKITMYKSSANTDGFTLYYNVVPADAFEGWPELTHTFGGTLTQSALQTETFDYDLATINTCVDS